MPAFGVCSLGEAALACIACRRFHIELIVTARSVCLRLGLRLRLRLRLRLFPLLRPAELLHLAQIFTDRHLSLYGTSRSLSRRGLYVNILALCIILLRFEKLIEALNDDIRAHSNQIMIAAKQLVVIDHLIVAVD